MEASLQAASDLVSEREALNRQWQHRVERVRYEAERARRQYDAVEPENRLVVRTLERQWEQALAEQSRLEAEHEQFRREQPQALSPMDITAIRRLAKDLPAVWHGATQDERQTIVRLLLERLLVEVVDGSEQVRVECHWHGGNRTSHQLIRPVARLDRLSRYNDLLARAGEAHASFLCAAQRADQSACPRGQANAHSSNLPARRYRRQRRGVRPCVGLQISAIADADFAFDDRYAVEPFTALFIRHFEKAEAFARQVESAVNAPQLVLPPGESPGTVVASMRRINRP